jgi:hypothetical protein
MSQIDVNLPLQIAASVPQLGGDRSFLAPVETVWSHISGHSLFADRLDVTTMMSQLK